MPKPSPTCFYHTTPLHYAPYLLATGILYSQAELKRLGLPIRPRPTAARRDRKLKLDRYVHLSLEPVTPLLRHKLTQGYPHILLEFSREILNSSGSALCRYNAKSWRHREEFAPVTDPEEQKAVIEAWRTGRYPSAEILIPDALPLASFCTGILIADKETYTWLTDLCAALTLPTPTPLTVAPEHFPNMAPFDFATYQEYGEACKVAGSVLPPPDLPFD